MIGCTKWIVKYGFILRLAQTVVRCGKKVLQVDLWAENEVLHHKKQLNPMMCAAFEWLRTLMSANRDLSSYLEKAVS